MQHIAFCRAFSNPRTWPTVKSKQLNLQDLQEDLPGPMQCQGKDQDTYSNIFVSETDTVKH